MSAKIACRVWSFVVEKPRVVDGHVQADYGFALKMPRGARITRVGAMTGGTKLFAVVNPAMQEEERYFWVASTNSDLPSPEELEAKFSEANRQLVVTGLEPLGTWLEIKGTVAKHLFEITAKPASPRDPGED